MYLKSFFARRTPKFSLFGVVLRTESWFSRTNAIKFQVCRKLKQTWNFTALVRENQFSARKTTLTRLIFGIQRTKNIVRITCGTYFNAKASPDSLLRKNTPFRTWYEIYYFVIRKHMQKCILIFTLKFNF